MKRMDHFLSESTFKTLENLRDNMRKKESGILYNRLYKLIAKRNLKVITKNGRLHKIMVELVTFDGAWIRDYAKPIPRGNEMFLFYKGEYYNANIVLNTQSLSIS
jgi:hypothetical protein